VKSAITLCNVAEAAAGPFVYHCPLDEGFAKATAHGFDAVELFLPSATFVSPEDIRELAATHKLEIAAVGTGAGKVCHNLTLTDPDPNHRAKALAFVTDLIAFAGSLNAPAILGSMQGNSGGGSSREEALDWLADALQQCAQAAAGFGQPFIYEPLNRYETNLINRLGDATRFLDERQLDNVVLLADLFHMNIEESDMAAAILDAKERIGHVHYADSNRRAMGFGHTPPLPILKALREINYKGFLSAEIFPLPDADSAAAQTRKSIEANCAAL